MKKIAIFGSTGSIGSSLLKIIENDKKNFKIELLTANKSYKKLIKQAKFFNVKNLVITKNRLHKRIGTYVMPKNRSIEIDEPEDIKVLKIILDKKPNYKKSILKNFKII